MDNNISLNFNHPIKSILFGVFQLNQLNQFNIDNSEINKWKDIYAIDNLCREFNKLCIIPKTFNEFIDNLSQYDKDKLKNINNIENSWLENFLNNDYI